MEAAVRIQRVQRGRHGRRRAEGLQRKNKIMRMRRERGAAELRREIQIRRVRVKARGREGRGDEAGGGGWELRKGREKHLRMGLRGESGATG